MAKESKISKAKRSDESGQKYNWGQVGYTVLVNQHKGSGFYCKFDGKLLEHFVQGLMIWLIYIRSFMFYKAY